MTVLLLDEYGQELTEITSRAGAAPGQMRIEWAARPDLLFRYYFDRGGRIVTARVGTSEWSATLGTGLQMGRRSWSLVLRPTAPRVRRARDRRRGLDAAITAIRYADDVGAGGGPGTIRA